LLGILDGVDGRLTWRDSREVANPDDIASLALFLDPLDLILHRKRKAALLG
jgi:hypothetical protein